MTWQRCCFAGRGFCLQRFYCLLFVFVLHVLSSFQAAAIRKSCACVRVCVAVCLVLLFCLFGSIFRWLLLFWFCLFCVQCSVGCARCPRLGSPSFPIIVMVVSPVCDFELIWCVWIHLSLGLCAFGVSSARLLWPPGGNTPLLKYPCLTGKPQSSFCVVFIYLLCMCCPLSVATNLCVLCCCKIIKLIYYLWKHVSSSLSLWTCVPLVG